MAKSIFPVVWEVPSILSEEKQQVNFEYWVAVLFGNVPGIITKLAICF
ncbi:hypothetical protein [Abyssalbus ytuae]|uniref:Uncharacterized protein n=1 Tax=Abyssalbus ytuae TaxID=2926907 RepID=A0A9E7CSK3_9FLAO|nr:hypothetical protein [Abyssalbus ytuae]UOB16421.1 hypothetical protein MQE35_11810 [Abyssalbus ytuae]